MTRWGGLPVLLAAVVLAGGCRPREGTTTSKSEAPESEAAEHGHGHKDDHDHDHDHGHDEESESPSGASFKPGKGVLITEETRKILGLEVADVLESSLPSETRFTAQIFGERHHHLPDLADHRGCDVHGSGLVSAEAAAAIRKGDRVEIVHADRGQLHAVVLAVQTAVALGESEVIIGISNAISVLRPGEFVPAAVVHPATQPVTTVPTSALLRTAEGTFVYAVNGDAFLRTPVRTGTESGDRIAILDGLRSGEKVVVRPVQTLWLIELRATKGGGHSH